jgi:hypothetical protein
MRISLRHFHVRPQEFASRLVMAGVDLYTVKKSWETRYLTSSPLLNKMRRQDTKRNIARLHERTGGLVQDHQKTLNTETTTPSSRMPGRASSASVSQEVCPAADTGKHRLGALVRKDGETGRRPTARPPSWASLDFSQHRYQVSP